MKSLRYRIIAGVCILTCLIAGCGTAESDRNRGGGKNAGRGANAAEQEAEQDSGPGGGGNGPDGDGGNGPNGDGGNGPNGDGSGGQNSGNGNGSSLDGKDLTWQASYSPLRRRYVFALAADQLYGAYYRDGQILLDRIDRETGKIRETLVLSDRSREAAGGPEGAGEFSGVPERTGEAAGGPEGAEESSAGQEGTEESSTGQEVVQIAGMAADRDGNIYLLENRGDNVGLWKIDPEGRPQTYADLELEDTERAQDLRMKGIYTDLNGYLFVWCELTAPEMELLDGRENEIWHWEDRVYVKDRQLKRVFYEKIEDRGGTQVLNFQIGTEGEPVFVVKDSDGIYLQEMDVAGKGRKEAVRLEKAGDFLDPAGGSVPESIAPAEGGFLCCRENELYELHFDTQKAEKLLSLSTYGIFSEDILFLKKSGDVIEIIDNHGDSGSSEFISLTPGKTEKRIVTLGSTDMLSELERVVAEFNRYSTGYRVEILDYYALAGDCGKAVERLKLDVVSGKAPDLITTGGIDYSLLSRKGALADLYDFMEKDDQLTKDMLVRSVAEACEDGGHLYTIAPGFQLHTVWGYGDVIKGKSGVTFEEFIRLLEDSGKDINAITGFSADEPVLTRLCAVAMEEFVNWEEGTCSFDGDYFRRVLSFAGEYKGKDRLGAYSERVGNRETVMTVGMISSVADYQIQKALYGGDLDFIGYPAAEGSGTAVALRGSKIAINGRKEDQTGAWEFVKYYLLQGYDGQGFPVLQEEFDRVMKEAMEEDYGFSENGGIENGGTENGGRERHPKGFYGDGEVSFAVYAAEKEDVDAVRALVESARNRYAFHADIQKIIHEEAEGYFSGQMDLDKTVEKIQNRVTLFLQESR